MARNIVKEKSFEFAIQIVLLGKNLISENKEFIISKQIIRSGTSIGANIEEAKYAESDADFIHKLKIALKEANETSYWLRILLSTDYLSKTNFIRLHDILEEIIRLLVSIIQTRKKNIKLT